MLEKVNENVINKKIENVSNMKRKCEKKCLKRTFKSDEKFIQCASMNVKIKKL